MSGVGRVSMASPLVVSVGLEGSVGVLNGETRPRAIRSSAGGAAGVGGLLRAALLGAFVAFGLV